MVSARAEINQAIIKDISSHYQGCQVLVAEKNAKLCFKKGQILDFTMYKLWTFKKRPTT